MTSAAEDDGLREAVAKHIPLCVRRLLDVGCGRGTLGAALKRQRAMFVAGVESDPEDAGAAARVLDLVVSDPREAIAAQPGFDCIALHRMDSVARCAELIIQWLAALNQHGFFLVALDNPTHCQANPEAKSTSAIDALAQSLAPVGVVPYACWRIEAAGHGADHGSYAKATDPESRATSLPVWPPARLT